MAGIYIHIPFCKQACHYCDFHFSTNQSYKSEMISSICREIELQKDFFSGEAIDTIYFGGGTPSLLGIIELDKIFSQISKYFRLTENPEISFETNPDDISKDKLSNWKKLGINRLSIGIQSFYDPFLRFMNRAHTGAEAEKAVYLSQDSGFKNITVDLIYGIPDKDHQAFLHDLELFTSLETDHISAYCLTIEPKTVFGQKVKHGKMQEPSEDFAADQFKLLIDFLDKNNFEQYEISNFARGNSYSRHNTNYWKGIPYLGFGPGAHSYNKEFRQFNIANNHLYIKAINQGQLPCEKEVLSFTDKFNEYLLTNLRTKWGIDPILMKEDFEEFYHKIEPKIKDFLKAGLLEYDLNKITLSTTGKFIADEITAQLIQV